MEKYILGEISSSGGATLYKNPSDQTVKCIRQGEIQLLAPNRIISFFKKKNPTQHKIIKTILCKCVWCYSRHFFHIDYSFLGTWNSSLCQMPNAKLHILIIFWSTVFKYSMQCWSCLYENRTLLYLSYHIIVMCWVPENRVFGTQNQSKK